MPQPSFSILQLLDIQIVYYKMFLKHLDTITLKHAGK